MYKGNIYKKILAIIAFGFLLVLILIIGVIFYYREQSFLRILPEIPEFETEMVQIMKNNEENPAAMSNKLFDEFANEMNQFKYQHIKNAFGLDSFGRVVYLCDGRRVEIMFSNEQGGLILINRIGMEAEGPIYKVIGNNNQLEKIFDTYVDRAASQMPEGTE